MTRYGNTFLQQATGIFSQIKNQSLDVLLAKLLEIVFNFVTSCFGKLLNVQKGNTGTNPECFVDTVSRDLVSQEVKH